MSKTKHIDLEFRSGQQIIAHGLAKDILIDLPQSDGGHGAGPTPFDLFVVSLATCAGVYARRFCEAREIELEGLGFSMDLEYHQTKNLLIKVLYTLRLPKDFPEKFREPLIRTLDQCTVKKHLYDPPEFEVVLEN